MLVGDVVLVGASDEDGNTTDVPEKVAGLLASDERFVVTIQVADGQWYQSTQRHADYFEAMMWAMVLHERVPRVIGVDVLPTSEFALQQDERRRTGARIHFLPSRND